MIHSYGDRHEDVHVLFIVNNSWDPYYFLIIMGNSESAEPTENDDGTTEIKSEPRNLHNTEDDRIEYRLEEQERIPAEPKVAMPNKQNGQSPNFLEMDSQNLEVLEKRAATKTKHTRDLLEHAGQKALRNIKEITKYSQKEHEYRTVEIRKKHHAKLGIALEGGVTCPIIPGDPGIFIKNIIPGGPADGKLKKGDRILTVNGVNLTRVTLKFAIGAINKAPESVRLYVKNAPKRQQTINSVMKADFIQGRRSGFFSEQQLEEFQEAFSVFDTKGRGKISASQVTSLIRSLGHNIDGSLLDVYLNELELTVHRNIKFAEFVRLMRIVVEEQNQESHVVNAIRVFDDEETGFISIDDLKDAFKRMPGKERTCGSELKEILRRARPNKEGKISAEDFATLLMPSINLY